jgi:hypothetical protein
MRSRMFYLASVYQRTKPEDAELTATLLVMLTLTRQACGTNLDVVICKTVVICSVHSTGTCSHIPSLIIDLEGVANSTRPFQTFLHVVRCVQTATRVEGRAFACPCLLDTQGQDVAREALCIWVAELIVPSYSAKLNSMV